MATLQPGPKGSHSYDSKFMTPFMNADIGGNTTSHRRCHKFCSHGL